MRALKVTSFDHPTVGGPVSQIIQSAIDAGIARGTIEDTIAFVKTHSRPWVDSGKETAERISSRLLRSVTSKIHLHAAEALLDIAGRAIDAARANTTLETVSEATIKTGESKVLTTEIAIWQPTSCSSWRVRARRLPNTISTAIGATPRVHTLHDPVRWKFFHVGNYYLNGVHPPRHAWN